MTDTPDVHPVDDLAEHLDGLRDACATTDIVANHMIVRAADDPVDVEAAIDLWLHLLTTAKDLGDAADYIYRASGSVLMRSSFGDGHKPGYDQAWTDSRAPGRTFTVRTPSSKDNIDVDAVRGFLAEQVSEAMADGEGPDELVDIVLTVIKLSPAAGVKKTGLRELGANPDTYIKTERGHGPWRVTTTPLSATDGHA